MEWNFALFFFKPFSVQLYKLGHGFCKAGPGPRVEDSLHFSVRRAAAATCRVQAKKKVWPLRRKRKNWPLPKFER